MKQPTLKDFLPVPCGQVLTTVWLSVNLEYLIREWAISQAPGHGQLPGASGRAFAEWLGNGWADWTEDAGMPVQKILEGAVSEWCGGRSF